MGLLRLHIVLVGWRYLIAPPCDVHSQKSVIYGTIISIKSEPSKYYHSNYPIIVKKEIPLDTSFTRVGPQKNRAPAV